MPGSRIVNILRESLSDGGYSNAYPHEFIFREALPMSHAGRERVGSGRWRPEQQSVKNRCIIDADHGLAAIVYMVDMK